MTMNHRERHFAECDGPTKNILFDSCQTVSDGVWGTKDDGIKQAIETGWTQQGNKMLCPLCTAAIPAPRPQQKRPRVITSATVHESAQSDTAPSESGGE